MTEYAWAHDEDDEHWYGPFDSRAECVLEAGGDACVTASIERWESLAGVAKHTGTHWLMDQIIEAVGEEGDPLGVVADLEALDTDARAELGSLVAEWIETRIGGRRWFFVNGDVKHHGGAA